jgi:hypothetical protein
VPLFLLARKKELTPTDLWNVVHVEFPIIKVDPNDCEYRVATIGGLGDSSGIISYCPRDLILAVLE